MSTMKEMTTAATIRSTRVAGRVYLRIRRRGIPIPYAGCVLSKPAEMIASNIPHGLTVAPRQISSTEKVFRVDRKAFIVHRRKRRVELRSNFEL
jgi:hypothetical protein